METLELNIVPSTPISKPTETTTTKENEKPKEDKKKPEPEQ